MRPLSPKEKIKHRFSLLIRDSISGSEVGLQGQGFSYKMSLDDKLVGVDITCSLCKQSTKGIGRILEREKVATAGTISRIGDPMASSGAHPPPEQ